MVPLTSTPNQLIWARLPAKVPNTSTDPISRELILALLASSRAVGARMMVAAPGPLPQALSRAPATKKIHGRRALLPLTLLSTLLHSRSMEPLSRAVENI